MSEYEHELGMCRYVEGKEKLEHLGKAWIAVKRYRKAIRQRLTVAFILGFIFGVII